VKLMADFQSPRGESPQTGKGANWYSEGYKTDGLMTERITQRRADPPNDLESSDTFRFHLCRPLRLSVVALFIELHGMHD
jgi:hypothetical protein